MTYLHELTLRLAAGMEQVPEATRRRQTEFLLAAQREDGGFAGREGGSDLYYTGFALRSLAMLGVLEGPVAQHAADFLRSRMTGREPIVDFLSLVYGGMLLQATAGVDVFAHLDPRWRSAVAEMLERFRRADGGYAKTEEGQSSSTYHTFLFVLCNQLIGRPLANADRLADFVLSRQRDDGGFVEIGPMRTSGTNPTAAAVGLLKILERIDAPLRDDVVSYLEEMQSDSGGLTANGRIPVADVLSTFTGTLTLADLGGLDRIDTAAATRFVRSMELDTGGFLGGEWDSATDVEYTFYGLGALALLPAE